MSGVGHLCRCNLCRLVVKFLVSPPAGDDNDWGNATQFGVESFRQLPRSCRPASPLRFLIGAPHDLVIGVDPAGQQDFLHRRV